MSDTVDGRIVKMTGMDGRHFTSFGFPGSGLGCLLLPTQIWVDHQKRLYIADTGNNRIVRVNNMKGMGWTVMGGFEQPQGVAVCKGKLFVSDTGRDRIIEYSGMNGKRLRVLTNGLMSHPMGLWFDAHGDLYAACGQDPPGGSIVRIKHLWKKGPQGLSWTFYNGQGLSSGDFGPTGVVTVGKSVVAIDKVGDRLVSVDSMHGGDDAVEMGRYGTAPGRFLRPSGIAVDRSGRIYIADTGNDRIVRLDKGLQGGPITIYHRGPGPDSSLRGPRSIFIWSPAPPGPPPPKKKKRRRLF